MSISTLDSPILAEKLRNDDPEQFYTLVRMHLSFELDLNADDCDSNSEKKFRTPKWNIGLLQFSKKPKVPVKVSESLALTPDTTLQMQQLIAFLCIEDNISQEGIFRRSGKLTRQQALKTLISQGAVIDLPNSEYSVHDCASVLKSILSELPESILTDAHYPAYCQIAELFDLKSPNTEERLLRSLQLLTLLLPLENRKVLQEILALLHLAASYQHLNRMSAENLATLFTPHLLCPRKLSPEALHTNSQVMSKVVAFMIDRGPTLFDIPATLATDVRAYWTNKEKRRRSPLKQMNESVCDGTAASTVFSFVDRERTAQENVANPTETALAQLYAHIQSLPESSKKRKLIKQFNKENGHGTPLRVNCGQKKRTRSRSLGDSIKKHLPVFNKNSKQRPAVKSPMPITQLASPPNIDDFHLKRADPHPRRLNNDHALSCLRASLMSKSKSCDLLDAVCRDESANSLQNKSDETAGNNPLKRSATPPCKGPSPPKISCCTPVVAPPPDAGEWSETMMTPRSRKPVISLSGTDLCHLASIDSWKAHLPIEEDLMEPERETYDLRKNLNIEKSGSASDGTSQDSLSTTFRDYLFSRSVLASSPVDLSFSSRTDDFLSLSERNSSVLTEEFKSISESIMNQAGLSDSLLYCLDGNDPSCADASANPSTQAHVHETAL